MPTDKLSRAVFDAILLAPSLSKPSIDRSLCPLCRIFYVSQKRPRRRGWKEHLPRSTESAEVLRESTCLLEVMPTLAHASPFQCIGTQVKARP